MLKKRLLSSLSIVIGSSIGINIVASSSSSSSSSNSNSNSNDKYNYINSKRYISYADNSKKVNDYSSVAIISGTSSTVLSNSVASYLGTKVVEAEIERFSDGEISCKINESIRGKTVFIIQTCAAPVDDNIMELLLTVTAARRSGASKVIAIVPYFGYRHHRRGLPISTTYSSRFLWSASGDLAKMLQVVGVDSVVSVDLQRPGQGHEACFFDSQIPVETVSTNSLFVEYFKNVNLTEPVVIISPNPECVKKAKKFQEKLKLATGIEKIDYGVFLHDLDSATADSFTSTSLDLLGDVNGASVIIVEEVIGANYPILPLCNLLREQGAKRIIICASHGLFTPESCKVIEDSPIEKIVVSDSIELPNAANAPLNKISQVSTVALISNIIEADVFRNNSTADDEDQYLE